MCRKNDRKDRPIIRVGFYRNVTTMGLNYIITQTQPQSRSLPCRLGGEKGLKYFFLVFFRDAWAVVVDANLKPTLTPDLCFLLRFASAQTGESPHEFRLYFDEPKNQVYHSIASYKKSGL